MALTLQSLPDHWQNLDEVLLLLFVREGSGASLLTQNHVLETVEAHSGQVQAFAVDAEHEFSRMEDFRVSQVPSLFVILRGEIRASFSGLFPQSKLSDTVSHLLTAEASTSTQPHLDTRKF